MAKKDKPTNWWWMKLPEQLLNGDIMDIVLAEKDGASYVVIFEKLVFMTINNNGKLSVKVRGIDYPYDINKITRDLKFWQVDTVKAAIMKLEAVGLLYYDEKNILSISDFKELVGYQSAEARSKAEARSRAAKEAEDEKLRLLDLENSSGQMSDKCPDKSPIDIEEDIRIRNRSNSKTSLKEDNDFNKSIKGIEEAEYSATKKLFNDAVITTDMIGDIDEIFNKSDLSDYAVSLIVNEIMQFSKGKIYNPIAYFTRAFGKQEYLWKNNLHSKNEKIDIDPDDFKEIIENAKKVWFTDENEGGNES